MSGGDTHAHECNSLVMHDAKENVTECTIPTATPTIAGSKDSKLYKPDAAGMMKEAVITVIQKKNTRRPARVAVGPSEFACPARYPNMELPIMPIVPKTPHKGPGNQG